MIQWKFTELALMNIFIQETVAFKHSLYSWEEIHLYPQNNYRISAACELPSK